ncbi:hypothetical protein DL546_001256 [Coniochaeta pulveracea]|uniref:Capsule polysaccharide biosynthesis protein n=1 Tax=Coniochaeta pulveracea TaxID=177199 RepID=A0A420Y137_9PEZI|nr:hypothetical protein DL546_001256 [Coniochaeta pulveracea]
MVIHNSSKVNETNVSQLSDEEILADLQTFKPLDGDSEKNIWAYWDKGLANCPPWGQRNIISWVRRHDPSWTVRVLDTVEGSPTHVSKYISDDFFPDSFRGGTMSGPHVGPHSSDLVRLPLLYLYGGIWVDVGFLLFRSLDNLCWNVLSNTSNTLELAAFAINMGPGLGMTFNGFIAARRGCLCIKYWHDTFLETWKGVNSTTGMSNHPLLQHLPRYEPPSRNGKMPPFRYAQFADYLAQVLCLERVRHLRDHSVNWDGPEYFARRVLLFDCPTEVYWAQRVTDWDGRKQFELLCRQRKGVDLDTPEYKEADQFVSSILENSTTMKISHGLATAGREYLAELWDKPENKEADRRPGTFAAVLRQAAVELEQSRPLKPVLLPVITSALLKGDVLKALGQPRED